MPTYYATSRRLNEPIKILGRFETHDMAYQRCLIEQHEKGFDPISTGVRVMGRRVSWNATWAEFSETGHRSINPHSRIEHLRRANELKLCLTDIEQAYLQAGEINDREGPKAADRHVESILHIWDLSIQTMGWIIEMDQKGDI